MWLLDDKDAIKLEKKWKPWVNQVLSKNLIQEVYTSNAQGVEEYTKYFIDNFKIRKLTNEIFQIEASAMMRVINDNYYNLYTIHIKSKMRRVDRSFPKNPHGFMLYDFQDVLKEQESNIKISD
ncbi:MAG: hypothetical protein U5K27_04695 [Desulfotignum sp.]|nr:hypothetical protein [Desulfotignum sp.]